jgi:hypothetical protein
MRLNAQGLDPSTAVARSRTSAHIWMLSFLLLTGFLCRIYDLGRLPLWGDEAESSINALTILEQGFPADTYQGQPVYENWMIRRWPNNPEFEFRDISYSDRHLAVVHAWLPLYSIALSFRLFGITPSPAGVLRPQYGAEERLRRTVAARMPSVFFGMLCILGVYLAGCRLHGRETALIAAFLATFLAVDIFYSQTARYYAATAAGITFCIWATLVMRQSAKWRDFLIGSVLFSLLFYTHLVAFTAAFLTWFIVMASRPNQWRAVAPKALVFVGVIAALCTPWLISTSFFQHSGHIPKAWRLLTLPGDLIVIRLLLREFGFVLILGAVLASAVVALKGRVPPRIAVPLERLRTSLVIPYLWLVVTCVVFFFGIPPASFAVSRLDLLLLPAALLFLAMVFCSVAAVVTRKKCNLRDQEYGGQFILDRAGESKMEIPVSTFTFSA